MKLGIKFILFAVVLLLVGCSSTPKQFKDASWTQKPANMKTVFTQPAFVPDSTLSFWKGEYVKDSLPDEMKPISDWFAKNLDNTFKFNLSTHYSIAEVAKDQVSSFSVKLDGEDVSLPKLESMSDSFEVYLVIDDISMGKNVKSSGMNAGMGPNMGVGMGSGMGTGMGVGMGFGTMGSSGENVKITARYAFFDVKTRKLLNFGSVEKSHFAEKKAIEHDWVDALRDLALEIIGQTPVGQN